MADATKHPIPINGSTLISDLKNLFSLRTKTTATFAYASMLAFILFTAFFAFNPSQNSASPWFSNIFTAKTTTDSNGSTFSLFSYLFPNSTNSFQNSTSLPSPTNITGPHNTTFQSPKPEKESSNAKNKDLDPKVESLKPNQSKIEPPKSDIFENQTANSKPKSDSGRKNTSRNGDKGIAEKGLSSNLTSTLLKNEKQSNEDMVKSLMKCDMFDGSWVRDDSYPLYKPGSCSFIDQQFNCLRNGRPDTDYQKLKWTPKGCNLPRLNGSHMLEMLRGKRLVFVGDSLNRNMWESLVCILKNSVKNQTKVYEASGRYHFRSESSYSFIFEDYNCSVELFVSPFLVREWIMADKNGSKKETLRLDLIGSSADKYKNADIIIFNTGHWWTHDKTSKGKDYYQEGSHVYDELNVLEAFRKAMTTWAGWVDANINPMRTLVFFRGYSATHFSGGQWNSGGQCDHQTEPIKNETYLSPYPPKMAVLEKVLKGMKKIPVSYLNITRLTDYRKDGHPSMYRKQHLSSAKKKLTLQFQDCSHWCLPGVPDSWNELLYAELLVKQHQKQEQKNP